MKNFVSPHVHIKSLDSVGNVEDFARKEVELDTGYLVVTDHGTLEACRSVYDICNSPDSKYQGKLKPICGIEAYMRDDNCDILQSNGVLRTLNNPKRKDGEDEVWGYKNTIKYIHITLHALDETAFFELTKTLSKADYKAEKHGSERKPLFDWTDLAHLGQYNITATSGCFVPGTLVSTVGGTKKIEDMKSGDLVYDNDGILQRVITPTYRQYSGEMVRMKVASVHSPIHATGNHEFQKLVGPNKFEWVSASQLKKNDRIRISVENRPGLVSKKFDYKHLCLSPEKEERVTGDFSDPEMLWAIGLFIAEGNWGSGDRPYSIGFSLHEKEVDKGKRIEAWALKYGATSVNLSYPVKSKSLTVTVNSAAIAHFFLDLFGGKCKSDEKHIPEVLKDLSTDLLRHLICGYFDGDGHEKYRTYAHKRTGTHNVRRTNMTTVSRRLINDVQAVLRRIGIWANAHTRPSRISSDGTRHKQSYSLQSSGDDAENFLKWIRGYWSCDNKIFTANITEYKKYQYDGPVHCLNIENNPSFSLEGGVVVHNCLIGAVGRHLMKNNDLASAIGYYEKIRRLFKPGNFFVEIMPHSCDQNWVKNVTFEFEGHPSMTVQAWKKCQTNAGDFEAEELAKLFKNNPESFWKTHKTLIAVMDNRKWTPKNLGLRTVALFEGAMHNECTDWAPDGAYQIGLNKVLLQLANQYGDPVLISDDSHFPSANLKLAQDVKLGQGGSWKFTENHHRYSSDEAFKFFEAKMGMSYKQFEEYVQNGYDWASRFDGFKFSARQTLPVDFYPKDTLKYIVDIINAKKRMKWDNPIYVERLSKEIKMLHQNGKIDLLPYFATSEEGVREANLHGVYTGVGRGSSAGLLLAYCLGITHLDPIEGELSEDRFLTTDRILSGKMPDIDQDFENTEVITGENGWLQRRFGECAAQIATDVTAHLSTAIKDVWRAKYGEVPEEIEEFAKKLPKPPQGVNDIDFVFGYDSPEGEVPGVLDLSDELQKFTHKYPDEWNIITQLLATTRQRSRHPCARAIANEPISNFIPMTTIGDVRVTAFTAAGVEAMGVLKMDYLTINTLGFIHGAVKLIQDRHCPSIDWSPSRRYEKELPFVWDKSGKAIEMLYAVPFNNDLYSIWNLPQDPKAIASVVEGNVQGVFQLDTPGAQKWLKVFNFERPDGKGKGLSTIQDLCAFVALDRPGPLDAYVQAADGTKHNMLVEYARRAKGLSYSGDIPELSKLIPETLGIPTYQEQVTKIYRHFTGCSGAEAEEFRSFAAKKKVKKMQEAYTVFMDKASTKVPTQIAQQIWDRLITFSNYGFCKAHALSYSTISYACAWLKYHYPLEWWTSVLSHSSKDSIDTKYWKEVSKYLLLPDIMKANDSFVIEGDKIRAPISMLNGIGDKQFEQLVSMAPYKDIYDLLQKIEQYKQDTSYKVTSKDKNGNTVVTKRKGRSALSVSTVAKMIVAGVCDGLFPETDSFGLPLTVEGKLTELAKAEAVATNKKKLNNYATKYHFNDLLLSYQNRKNVLTSYSEDLLPIVKKCRSDLFLNENGACVYKAAKRSYIILPGTSVEEIEQLPMAPRDGINYGGVAYVISQEKKMYKDKNTKQQKERCSLLVDFDGFRKDIMIWPDSDGKLPEAVENSVDGGIVLVLFYKRPDGKVYLNDVKLISEPLKRKVVSDEAE